MNPRGLVPVDRWLGLRGAVLEPAAMLFVAVERDGKADDCRGCVFRHQMAAVCREACSMAVRAGQRDCEAPTDPGKRIIYVASPNDPRQSPLF